MSDKIGQNIIRGDYMQNWKKTGAALLVATLTVSGAGYAWANNNYDTVNINDVNKNTQETPLASETAQVTPATQTAATSTTAATTAQTTTNKDFPMELATEKLVGLVKAYETASNDDAKAAILNVINRVIAEYETTQKDIYQKKAPELTAAIDRLIVLFKDYQQAPNADKKAAIIAQVKAVVAELQNYLNKQEEPKENTPPVIVPPIKDKDKDKPKDKDKDKANKDKENAELEKKKAEEKAAKEAAKAAAEAKRAQEKAAREAAQAAKQAEIEAAKKAKAAELAAKKAAQEQKKAEQKPKHQHKHPNGKDDNRHNKGPKHDKHQKHKDQHNKHDHKKGHQGQGKNDRN